MRAFRFAFVAAALLWPALAAAKPGAGTLADPIRVDAFPYVVKGDTSKSASSAIDAYDCSPATDESGPEVVYRFVLADSARVTAWASGDGGAVDIDVQILNGLDVQGAFANGCVARNNHIAEANMGAGTHYVVVDSYKGAAQAGPFVLHLDAVGDAWNERQIAEGVVWRSRRFQSLAGGAQVVNGLVIDTQAPGVTILAAKATGCQTIAAMATTLGAVAAVNGGFWSGAMCTPGSLLKSNGSLQATNSAKRGAFGVDVAGAASIALIAAGQDWPAVTDAHGGGPVLTSNGSAKSGNAAWAAESFQDAAFLGKLPRTLAGVDAGGKVLFGVVDGQRANAKGMSLDELAAFSVSAEFAAASAVNLDGGGSSTMFVADATYNGVVNYPSGDPNQELSTHPGGAAVSGGFFVLAPPYNHTPRFQTDPPLDAAVGKLYTYDADALDLDVDDTLTYALSQAPAGMKIDAVTGEIAFTPDVSAPASIDVILTVSDPKGAAAAQSFTLVVAGGQAGSGGAGGAGAGGAAGAGGGMGGSAGGDVGGAAGGDAGGSAGAGGDGGQAGAGGDSLGNGGDSGDPQVERRCSCRVPGGGADDVGGAIAFVLMLLGLGARRKHGPSPDR